MELEKKERNKLEKEPLLISDLSGINPEGYI